MEGLLDESVCKRTVVVRTEPITDHYIVEARPFARGKFATVRRCRHRSSGAEYAAKYMRKRRRASDVRHEILHEAHVLELSRMHPHIVRMHEVYETPSEIVLLLELVPGGELQRVLDDEEVVPEAEARRLLRQILDGVAFLHQHNIAHLDLKPQNLLLTKPFPEGEVKLCDFGISRLITKGIEIREIVGTPDYVAPEVLHYEPISLPTDMWSLGILTYVLLSGHSPFGGDTKQETFCNITRGSLDFPSDLFAGVSDCAVDFVRKLLLRNPKERMTAEECLSHPWLSNGGSMLPGIQLTLSPENTLVQKEEHTTRSPSPVHSIKDTAPHNSPSPNLNRSSVKSPLDHANGTVQKEETESSCLVENVSDKSPSLRHNDNLSRSPIKSNLDHTNGTAQKEESSCLVENVSDESPSLKHNGNLSRSSVESPLDHTSQTNGTAHKEDTACLVENVSVESPSFRHNGIDNEILHQNGEICKTPSLVTRIAVNSPPQLVINDQSIGSLLDQQNGNVNGSPAIQCNGDSHDQNLLGKSPPLKASIIELNSSVKDSSLSQKDSPTQCNGKEQNENGINLIYSSANGTCHTPQSQEKSEKVSTSVFLQGSKLSFNGNEQEESSSIYSCNQQQNGQKSFCQTIKVSKTVFNGSSLHSTDHEVDSSMISRKQQYNVHDQSAFCHSVKISKSVFSSSSYNEQDGDSSNCHSLKVAKSLRKNSCNENDSIEGDTNNGKSPSFRHSPSPGRREQKSRNSVDMMVSQFEGISKRIVFSEDICVDERVGMVY